MVDSIAGDYAKRVGVPVQEYPADHTLGNKGFYLRNKKMVDSQPDIVLAFPRGSSKGTHLTIDLSLDAGIPTKVFEPRV